mgnify:FL=1
MTTGDLSKALAIIKRLGTEKAIEAAQALFVHAERTAPNMCADQIPSRYKPFITVDRGMAGHFAVKMWWNDKEEHGGFWEPYDTGSGRYSSAEEAWDEAYEWAKAERLDVRR